MASKPTENPRAASARYWQTEITAAEKYFDEWKKTGERVVKRYRDDRDLVSRTRRKFNILFSNVQVLGPALYGRKPKPQVTRRYKDADPIARAASTILERCLTFEVDCYSDFDSTMKQVVQDRLLPGRGAAWVRFDAEIGTDPYPEGTEEYGPVDEQEAVSETRGTGDAQVTEDVEGGSEYVAAARTPVDYVHWEDFLHSPARTWEEVWWVARRVWMGKEEGEGRFGEEVFKNVPLEKDVRTSYTKKGSDEPLEKKAQVWEIWNKNTKRVCWIAKGYPFSLDERDDPLGLKEFFPCPKPLFGITTNDSTIPVPDYVEYQDQAEEVDVLTQRISMLTRALKVAGVYNQEFKELNRLLNESIDNRMIGVSSWAAFAEKGGLKGSTDWLPIETIMQVLVQLYQAREQAKQTIYEVMGISDIIRGATKAEETLGAQQIKASFGSMRLKQYQGDTARFASDLFNLKAQVITKHYPPALMLQMSGFENTADAPLAMQAIQLLKTQPLESYRIEVEADTLAQMDDQQEKAEKMEFLQAAGAGIKGVAELSTVAPQLVPLGIALLEFGVRSFKVARDVEAAFDQAKQAASQQGPQVPPEMMKQIQEQAQQQADQKAAQNHATKEIALNSRAADLDVREMKFNAEQVIKKQLDDATAQLDAQNRGMAERDMEMKRQAADQDEKMRTERMNFAESRAKEAQGTYERVQKDTKGRDEALQNLLEAIVRGEQSTQQMLAQILKALASPKRIVRDPNSGRASGLETVG